MKRGSSLERKSRSRDGIDKSLRNGLIHVIVQSLGVATNEIRVGEAITSEHGCARIHKSGQFGVLEISV